MRRNQSVSDYVVLPAEKGKSSLAVFKSLVLGSVHMS